MDKASASLAKTQDDAMTYRQQLEAGRIRTFQVKPATPKQKDDEAKQRATGEK